MIFVTASLSTLTNPLSRRLPVRASQRRGLHQGRGPPGPHHRAGRQHPQDHRSLRSVHNTMEMISRNVRNVRHRSYLLSVDCLSLTVKQLLSITVQYRTVWYNTVQYGTIQDSRYIFLPQCVCGKWCSLSRIQIESIIQF